MEGHTIQMIKSKRINALALMEDGTEYTIEHSKNPFKNTGECTCTHTEMRVIHQLQGNIHTVMLTQSPCKDCATAMVELGVKVVGYLRKSSSGLGLKILLENGVTLIDMTSFLKEVG